MRITGAVASTLTFPRAETRMLEPKPPALASHMPIRPNSLELSLQSSRRGPSSDAIAGPTSSHTKWTVGDWSKRARLPRTLRSFDSSGPPLLGVREHEQPACPHARPRLSMTSISEPELSRNGPRLRRARFSLSCAVRLGGVSDGE